MEVFNENIYLPQNRRNLKSTKSPFDPSKKSNKKALSDIKNVLHHQKNSSIELVKRSNHHSGIPFPDSSYQLSNTFEQQKKSVSKKWRETILNKMDDESFICKLCLDNTNNNDAYDTLPEDLRLTCDEIHNFATNWSNCKHLDINTSLTPVKCNLDILEQICLQTDIPLNGESSLINMLDEAYENMKPQVFPQNMEIF